MSLSNTNATNYEAYRLGGLVLFGAAAVILTALSFEHLGGYIPCPLCLQQRYAYYAGIPLAFIAMASASSGSQLAKWLFFILALAFLANAGLGVYQAGAEWKFWPGPDTCGTLQAMPKSTGDLLKGLAEGNVVRCDEASFRFLGLSFAGWNVVASILLFGLSIRAAFAASNRD